MYAKSTENYKSYKATTTTAVPAAAAAALENSKFLLSSVGFMVTISSNYLTLEDIYTRCFRLIRNQFVCIHRTQIFEHDIFSFEFYGYIVTQLVLRCFAGCLNGNQFDCWRFSYLVPFCFRMHIHRLSLHGTFHIFPFQLLFRYISIRYICTKYSERISIRMGERKKEIKV